MDDSAQIKLDLGYNDKRFKPFNQPENLSSLAAKYEVSLHTFKKWLKPIQYKINLKPKKIFTPAELKIIIEFLGEYNVGD